METMDNKRPAWVDREGYPFQAYWMIVKGHLLHYVDEGPRDKPVILFLHPGPAWSYTYRYQIRQLSNEFRCVAPDFPGYGFSKAADGYNYTLQEQSEVLEAFVDTLELRNIILWMNDGGGATGILALAPQSTRVLGLVVGGTFGWSIKQYHSVTRVLRLVTSPLFRFGNRYTNILAWSMGKMALGTHSMSKIERKQYKMPFKERDARNRPLKLFRSFLDPLTQQLLNDSLPAFRNKPILIQFGEKDPMTAQGWPERWAREIPNHRVHLLAGAKHFPFEDSPEETVNEFRKWWAEISLDLLRNKQ